MNSQLINRPKIAVIITSVLVVKFFLQPHLNELSKIYDVTLFFKNDDPEIFKLLKLSDKIKIKFINIERNVNIIKDISAFFYLIWVLVYGNFNVVHTLTPKAGLLGIFAATICKVPIRIHTFQGEAWLNKTGIWRLFLKSLDKLISHFATNILVVSSSEREFLIANNIILRNKSEVLAHGSITGVDINRFKPDSALRESARNARGYSKDEIVFLYLGRLNKDKGIKELLLGFKSLVEIRSNVRLLIVGPDDGILNEVLQFIATSTSININYEPFTEASEYFMNLADVLVLPSYREGFGVVIIEAAATGITAIGSRIYGISDALIDGQTGLMCNVGDSSDLTSVMLKLAEDSELRFMLANNARNRVFQEFRSDIVINAFMKYYEKILSAK